MHDDAWDQVLDTLLEEAAGGERPPDLADRVVCAAETEGVPEWQSPRPRMVAAAAALLVGLGVIATTGRRAAPTDPPKAPVRTTGAVEPADEKPPTAPVPPRFVDTTYWRLDCKPTGRNPLGRLRVGGELYHYFTFTVSNPGKLPRKVDLQIFLMVDQVREGVSVDAVRAFDGFRRHQLPTEPASETEVFDHSAALQRLRRYYDRPHGEARRAVLAKIGAGYRRASEIGVLAPGASVKGVATFAKVDPRTDYAAVVVKGLVNRIINVGDERFMEDRALLVRYYTPGSPGTVDDNPIIAVRPSLWRVIKREKITYPVK